MFKIVILFYFSTNFKKKEKKNGRRRRNKMCRNSMFCMVVLVYGQGVIHISLSILYCAYEIIYLKWH